VVVVVVSPRGGPKSDTDRHTKSVLCTLIKHLQAAEQGERGLPLEDGVAVDSMTVQQMLKALYFMPLDTNHKAAWKQVQALRAQWRQRIVDGGGGGGGGGAAAVAAATAGPAAAAADAPAGGGGVGVGADAPGDVED
jgi:hypothetical protein